MNKYKIIMDFAGWLELELEAKTKEEAIDKAFKVYSHHDIVELEIQHTEVEKIPAQKLERKRE